jgi:6-phosphogluconolactonase/glucosamine-6-phosphate isomerase/deaminase
VLDRARKLLFLVTGKGKQEALRLLLAGDPSIPAGRIDNENAFLVTDSVVPVMDPLP